MTESESSRLRAAAELAAARAGAYEVLAALYLSPPTEELVAGLLKLAASPVMAALSDGPAAECLRRYASAYSGELDALRQEFEDLLVVPLGRYVTPYEAVYRDERLVGETVVGGLLMGPSTVSVLSHYRASGVAVGPDCGELPDHIGVELSFMAVLCGREKAAWEAGDVEAAAESLKREQGFLEGHLVRWVPALCRRMAENAASDFYRGIALLTDEFVRADARMLAAQLECPASSALP